MHNIKFEYRISILYMLFGGLWILFSDKVLFYLIQDIQILSKIQTFKGWFYVFFTAALFFFFLKKHLQELRSIKERLDNQLDQYQKLNQEIVVLNEELNEANEELQVREESLKAKNDELLAAEEELRANLEELGLRKQEIERSEERFRFLSSLTTEGIIIHDQGVALEVNDSFCQLFGYTREEIIGKNVIELLSTQQSQTVYKNAANEISGTYQLDAIKKNKKVIPIELSSRQIEFKGQTAKVAAIRDISQRKQAELRIHESEERFRLAMQGSNDGLWDWDLKTNEVYFSPRWKEMLGYADEELENKFCVWEQLVHPDDVEEALTKVNQFINGHLDSYNVEFRMRHKLGENIYILARGYLMRDESGKAIRIIGTHQDLTERYLVEQKLKEQVEENLSLYEEYRTINEELHEKNNNLLAAEEELRASNEELFEKNQNLLAIEEELRDANNDLLSKNKLLLESEERFRLLSDFSFEGLIIHDNGTIVNANHSFMSMMGLESTNSLIGKTLPLEILSPESLNVVKNNMKNHFNGKYEIVAFIKGGNKIDVELETIDINYNGKAMRLVAARNITGRKQNELIAKSRLAILEAFSFSTLDEVLVKTIDEVEKLTNSKIGFYHFVDEETNNLTLQAWSTQTSQSFCKIAGKGMHYPVSQAGVWVDCIRERKPIIHNDYSGLKHKKGLPEGHAPVERQLVVPIIRADKIVAVIGIGNKPTYYNEHDVRTAIRIADLAWDIAERKRAEQLLIESEKRFKTMFERSKSVMLLIDTENLAIVKANDSAALFYGYSPDELTKLNMVQINTLPKQEVRKMLLIAKREERNHFRFMHRLKTGELRDVDVYTSPVKYSDKTILHSIVIDQTQMVQTQKEIRKINNRLEGLDSIVHYKAKSISDLLDFTLGKIIEYLQGDIGYIYNYKKDGNIFLLNNWSESVKLSFQLESDEKERVNCLSQAVTEKKPIIINQLQDNYSFLLNTSNKEEHYKSVAIPVIVHDEVEAVVWIGSYNNDFSEFDATQVSLLLETTWILVERQKLQDKLNLI